MTKPFIRHLEWCRKENNKIFCIFFARDNEGRCQMRSEEVSDHVQFSRDCHQSFIALNLCCILARRCRVLFRKSGQMTIDHEQQKRLRIGLLRGW